MSNIVIIQGSPRKDGNTARLVRAFQEGVSKKHQVTLLEVSGLHINYCTGCNSCATRKGKRCVQKDDMEKIMPILAKADILVFASPVYFYGISAQLKTLLERLHTPLRNSFKVKQTALLLVGAATLPELFDPILSQYRMLLRFFQLEDIGTVLVRGVKDPGDIDGRPELQEARKLGERIGVESPKDKKKTPEEIFRKPGYAVKSYHKKLTRGQAFLMEWLWEQDDSFRSSLSDWLSVRHDSAWNLPKLPLGYAEALPLLKEAEVIQSFSVIDDDFVEMFDYSSSMKGGESQSSDFGDGVLVPVYRAGFSKPEEMKKCLGWTFVEKGTSGGLFCELGTVWQAQKALEDFQKEHPGVICQIWHDIELVREDGSNLTDVDVLVRVGERLYFVESKACDVVADNFHSGHQEKIHKDILARVPNNRHIYCLGNETMERDFSQPYILLENFRRDFLEILQKDWGTGDIK